MKSRSLGEKQQQLWSVYKENRVFVGRPVLLLVWRINSDFGTFGEIRHPTTVKKLRFDLDFIDLSPRARLYVLCESCHALNETKEEREEEEEEEEEAFGDPSVHPSVIIGTRTVIHST